MELTITLQDNDESLAEQLQEEANRLNISVDALVLHLLRNSLTTLHRTDEPKVYHDLDDLAGTWTPEEAASFETVMADFETVDEGLWS